MGIWFIILFINLICIVNQVQLNVPDLPFAVQKLLLSLVNIISSKYNQQIPLVSKPNNTTCRFSCRNETSTETSLPLVELDRKMPIPASQLPTWKLRRSPSTCKIQTLFKIFQTNFSKTRMMPIPDPRYKLEISGMSGFSI